MNRFSNLVARCSQALALMGLALMFVLVAQASFRAITVDRTGSWKSSEPGIHADWRFKIVSSIEASI